MENMGRQSYVHLTHFSDMMYAPTKFMHYKIISKGMKV